MIYLTDQKEIKDIILDLEETDILWLDTEVADYKTKKPRLSLIQILAYPHNLNGDRTYLFDVLDNDDLINFLIEKIMKNEKIKKVFHNAKYDLRFLGKKETKNVFCTLEFAKTIPYYILPVKRYSLKVLTEYLTNFKHLSKDEQGSNWGVRPLRKEQLEYAKMDCVYLAQIYHQLMILNHKLSHKNTQEDLNILLSRYQEIEEKWLYLDSEKEYLESRIKESMLAQNILENKVFKLTYNQRNIIKTNIQELFNLVKYNNLNFNFEITLTKDIQSKIGDNLPLLKTELETKTYYSLKTKN